MRNLFFKNLRPLLALILVVLVIFFAFPQGVKRAEAATLPSLRPDGDGTDNANFQNETATCDTVVCGTSIDRDPDNALDESEFNENAPTETSASQFYTLTAMPADFGSMDTVTIDVRAKDIGDISDDTLELFAQICTSTEDCTAGNALTDEVSIATSATLTTSYQVFTGTFTLDANNTKAGWDGARLRLRLVYTKNHGGDDHQVRYTGVELDGTYTVAAAATLQQNYFQWYENTNALKPTTAWDSLGENVAIGSSNNPPRTGETLRLRVSVLVTVATLVADSKSFEIHWAEKVGASCTDGNESFTQMVTSGSCAAADEWCGDTNAGVADGTSLSGDPPTGGDLVLSVSDRAGRYEEDNPSANNEFAVAITEDVEYDWVIKNNNAKYGTSYCFEMRNTDDSQLNGGAPANAAELITEVETLTFSIDSNTVTFTDLDAGNSFTDTKTNTLTTTTSAKNGYVTYAWSTQAMTHVNYGSITIQDFQGSNATPDNWETNCITDSANQCGHGYTTDDGNLVGADTDRFTVADGVTCTTAPCYAEFVNTGPGDPVGDRTTAVDSVTDTITYKISTDSSQTAGDYDTIVVYIVVPTY